MKIIKKLLCLLVLQLAIVNLWAQETTASITGTIIDEKKEPVAFASVSVTHVPTGSLSGAQSNEKGYFAIPNLLPGGPYTIIISFVGYKDDTIQNVNLSLGDNPPFNVTLKNEATELTEVKVSASRTKVEGTGIDKEQINTLPTLGRSLSDYTRLTPQSNNNSFAGTSFRYNNITLDGAINNDAIGFSNSFGGQSGQGQAGTAGAGTRTTPYSMDAIQEAQVQLAPYDVKLGNFTGGSVNAVTKSGTNDFHGDAYFYGRNGALVGKSPDANKTKLGSNFYDYQTGLSISGPIVKNKLFFFLNGEVTRHQEPTFYNAGDPGSAITPAVAQQITDKLKNTYGYDPGTYGAAKIHTIAYKFFGRLDYNINKNNTLLFRAIYTDGSGQNLERTTTNFQFGNTDFTQHTKNLNLVTELKSTLKSNVFNSVILSFIDVNEYRDHPGKLAPFIDIGGGQIWAGTWREASVYSMKQKTFELTDNVTYYKGINKFTFGTHNEFYKIGYNFVNSWNGRWEYANVNAFLADMPTRIRGSYAYNANDNNSVDLNKSTPGGKFGVYLLSFYAQDEIAATHNFKLTVGLRMDVAGLPKQISRDSAFANTADYVNPTGQSSYSHTGYSAIKNKWLNNVTVSPRIGFSWDIKGDQKYVIRGGSGIFTGRMPFAWLGYAYTLSGSNFGTIDYKPNGTKVIGLAMDPTTLRDTVTKYGGNGASATHELDIVDNHFHLPSVVRSNLAADIKFANGYKFTFDVMYTKTIYDVKFQQINLKDTFTYLASGPTQTPVYLGGKVNSAFSNVYLLSNTHQGYRYNITAQLSKDWTIRDKGDRFISLYASVAYTYGKSKDVANGIRNSFQSNYEVNPAVSPENPTLAYSNFDVRHRVVSVFSGNQKWNKNHSTSFAFFYSGTAGSPYSLIYSASPNEFNNSSNATLIYIPKDNTDINFKDVKDGGGNVIYSAAQQWTDFNSFISNDKYLNKHRGSYAERNGLRTPWNHDLDLKIMYTGTFNVSKKRTNSIQFSMDMFNLLNMFSNNLGRQYFVTNVNNYTVNALTAVTDANGVSPGKANYTPTYNYVKPTFNGHYYTVDPISSRWQIQFGLKYIF